MARKSTPKPANKMPANKGLNPIDGIEKQGIVPIEEQFGREEVAREKAGKALKNPREDEEIASREVTDEDAHETSLPPADEPMLMAQANIPAGTPPSKVSYRKPLRQFRLQKPGRKGSPGVGGSAVSALPPESGLPLAVAAVAAAGAVRHRQPQTPLRRPWP